MRLDLRAIDPARFPNVFASLVRGRASTRTAEPVPVSPAAHYTMGGIAVDLDGPLLAARPLRRRRVLLHRPPRRQPPRLQLAQRVLRLRRPGGARRARRARSGDAPGRARVALHAAEPRHPRRRLAPRRPAPQPDRPGGADPRSLPAGEGDRGGGAGAARVPRPPPAHRLPGHRPGARRRPRRPRPRRLGPPGDLDVGRCCSGSTSAGPSPTPSCSTTGPSTRPRSRPRRARSRAG